MTWQPQITYVCNKIRSKLPYFHHLKHTVDSNTLLTLYNAFIYPTLIYCLESWGSATKTKLNRIHLLQKKIIRIIHKKPRLEHTAALFKASNVLNITNLYKYCMLIESFKYFHDPNTIITYTHAYNTRHIVSSIPYPKEAPTNNYGIFNYENMRAQLWNELPVEIRSVVDLGGFKVRLRGWLLE